MGRIPDEDEGGGRNETVAVPSATNLQLDPPPPGDAPPVELTRGTVLGGRYVVQKVLGRGGMGVVLRAFDRVVEADVALKVLRPEYAADRHWVDRLAREVKLARTINDPNVCRVFDFGEADGHAFLTMELATGGTLRDVLGEAAKARTSDERIADALAVIRGLAAIHAAGIVHRDVTPQNVLRMSDGRLVVSDFGLAAVVSGTTASIHGGTIGYMAPEVLRGARATYRSDVWALGKITNEILAGSGPEWPSNQSPRITYGTGRPSKRERSLLDVCRWCLSVSPAGRPSDAAKILSALDLNRGIPRRWRRYWVWALAVGLASVAAIAVGLRMMRNRGSPVAISSDGDAVILNPVPDSTDWLASARAIASYDERLECVLPLPGEHAIRVITDEPRRAEDIDLANGHREPARLLPITIREGCARLSPDGTKLAYQGRDDKGRPHVLVSKEPNGAAAIPTVSSAEPSVDSEPQWIDNDTFVFDVDFENAAVFSLATERMAIVPGARDRNAAQWNGIFKAAHENEILIAHSAGQENTTATIFKWPSLKATATFLARGFLKDWQLYPNFVAASADLGDEGFGLLRIDRHRHDQATFTRLQKGKLIRFAAQLRDGRAVSWRKNSRIM